MHSVQSQVTKSRTKLIFCISCVLFIVSDKSVQKTPDTTTICLVSDTVSACGEGRMVLSELSIQELPWNSFPFVNNDFVSVFLSNFLCKCCSFAIKKSRFLLVVGNNGPMFYIKKVKSIGYNQLL